MMDAESWRKQLDQERRQKDRAFRSNPQSPIPEDRRERFEGLGYYPPDPEYRLVVPLEPIPEETVVIPRTTGDEVEYRKIGRFDLELPEGHGEVVLFEQDHGDHTHPFLPIRDATSGDTTYGAGRYLDPQPLDDGRFVLDLNRLYHPFCAYDEAYACPMTPPENHLPFPVRAGERLPPGERG